MKKVFSALFVLALATPRVIVNPNEAMVVVKGLEFLGASRISTVTFCAHEVGVDSYHELATDSEFEGMHACLVEHT